MGATKLPIGSRKPCWQCGTRNSNCFRGCTSIGRFIAGGSWRRRRATRLHAETRVDPGSAQRDCPARNFRTAPQFAGARPNQQLLVRGFRKSTDKPKRKERRAHPDCARGIRISLCCARSRACPPTMIPIRQRSGLKSRVQSRRLCTSWSWHHAGRIPAARA